MVIRPKPVSDLRCPHCGDDVCAWYFTAGVPARHSGCLGCRGGVRIQPGRRRSGTLGLGWPSSSINGKVLLPSSGEFGLAKTVFNTNFNNLTPAASVTPASAADVQKAMAFAAAHNLKVVSPGVIVVLAEPS